MVPHNRTRIIDKAFRVQGIPIEILNEEENRDGLKNLLQTIIDDRACEIHIVSFTQSLNGSGEAIVKFAKTPVKLSSSDGQNFWTFDIPNPVGDVDKVSRGSMRRKQQVTFDLHFWNMTVLHAPKSSAHKFDVIAIHGLGGGHAYGSFKQKEGSHMWLVDALPYDIPEARIITYGYDTQLPNSISFKGLEDIASTFRVALRIMGQQRKNRSQSRKPLIFLAHSVGGLVLKQALVQMGNPRYADSVDKENLAKTRAILFFGVPNQGLDISFMKSMVEGQANEAFLMSLKQDSQLLRELNENFSAVFNSAHTKVISFFETKESCKAVKDSEGNWSMTGDLAVLVSQSSATHVRPWENQAHNRQAIDTDHSNLVKYAPNDSNYRTVLGVLRSVTGSTGPQVMPLRYMLVLVLLAVMALGALLSLRKQSGLPLEVVSIRKDAIGSYVDPQPFTETAPEICTHYLVPRRRVKDFVGREPQLLQIVAHFSAGESKRPRILILHALGGQGKSQIALEFCRRSRHTYRGIFWVNAHSEVMATRSFETIAAELDGTVALALENTEAKIRFVMRTLELWDERWLLVFDNYDPRGFPNVEGFIPSSGRGDILFTNRNKDLDRLGTMVEIPPMPVEEGVILLLRGYKSIDIQDYMVQASKIVTRLGGLALAIDQAASYLQYRKWPVERLGDFLEAFEAERKKILEYTPENFWEYKTVQIYGEVEQSHALSAFTTWQMSLEQLQSDDEQKQEDAAHFLTLSAFFSPTGVDESLFRHHWERTQPQPKWMQTLFITDGDNLEEESLDEGEPRRSRWNIDRFWNLIHKAHQLSLVESISSRPDDQGTSFSLHPLIRDWLQLREKARERRFYTAESIEFVVSSIQEYQNSTTTIQQKMLLMSHVDACVSNDEQFSKPQHSLGRELSTCRPAEWFAIFYFDQGRYDLSERLISLAVETKEKALGLTDRDTLRSMNNLATVLRHQGKHVQAEEIFRQALILQEKVLGKEHPNTLRSMSSLAIVLSNRGKYEQAEEIHQQALMLQEKVLGKEHPDTLTGMSSLATVLSDRGKYEQAEEIHRQALLLREKVLGKEHPNTLTGMSSLATLLSNRGRYEQAEEICRQVLILQEKVLGKGHPDILTIMNNLAVVLSNRGKYEQAEEMCRQTLTLYKKVLGKEHPNILMSMNSLAGALSNRGKYEQAEEMFREVLKSSETVLGKEHRITLVSMANLAWVFGAYGRWNEAEELEVQTMETKKKILGSEHPDTLLAMVNLAHIWKSQGRNEDAIALLAQAQKLQQQVLGIDHPSTNISSHLLKDWTG